MIPQNLIKRFEISSDITKTILTILNQSFDKPYFKEKKNDYWLYSHLINSAIYAGVLAEEIDRNNSLIFDCNASLKETPKTIFWGNLVHDIGKANLDEKDLYILDKPNGITLKEKNTLRNHNKIGYFVLEPYTSTNDSKSNKLPFEISYISLFHHEKFDGTGNPNGCKVLPMGLTLAKMIDLYESLTQSRPYYPNLKFNKLIKGYSKLPLKPHDAKVIIYHRFKDHVGPKILNCFDAIDFINYKQ